MFKKYRTTWQKYVQNSIKEINQKTTLGAKRAPSFSKKRSRHFLSCIVLMIVLEGKRGEMTKSKQISHQTPVEMQNDDGEEMPPTGHLF